VRICSSHIRFRTTSNRHLLSPPFPHRNALHLCFIFYALSSSRTIGAALQPFSLTPPTCMLSHLCSAQNSNCRRTTQDVCAEGTSVARPREDGLHTYPSATMLFELVTQPYTFFAFAIQMNRDSTFMGPDNDKETAFSGAKHSFTFASIVSMMSPSRSHRNHSCTITCIGRRTSMI
jgi:hypothetical protein